MLTKVEGGKTYPGALGSGLLLDYTEDGFTL